MVTIWNFETGVIYLTLLVILCILTLSARYYFRTTLRWIKMNVHTGLNQLTQTMPVTRYRSMSLSLYPIKIGLIISSILAISVCFLQGTNSAWLAIGTFGAAGLMPVILLFVQKEQMTLQKQEKAIHCAKKQEVRISELENLLYTSELTLANTSRCLEQEREKLKFAENKTKKAEARINKLEKTILPQSQNLRHINQLLTDTQEMAKIGSWEWYPESDEFYQTEGVNKILELRTNTITSLKDSLKQVHPDYRSLMNQSMSRTSRKGRSFDIEIKLITASKRSIWARAIGTPVKSKDQFKNVRGIIINIDEDKKNEEALVDLIKNLSKKTESLQSNYNHVLSELEELSYSVSHDLQAPLRVIDGFSTILEEDYSRQLDSEGKEVISSIQSNAVKTNLMINRILSLSSVGRKKISLTNIDTNTLLKEVMVELNRDQNIDSLYIKTQNDLPHISGDRSMIKQVFFNVLENAVKFSYTQENPIVEIGCTANPSKKMARFFVKDNGVGFDMKFHSKIFKVFKKLFKYDLMKGMGMGLALSKKVIDKHGGEIWATSTPGMGSTFFFTLPVESKSENSEDSPYIDVPHQIATN